jgi:hypothetical protein
MPLSYRCERVHDCESRYEEGNMTTIVRRSIPVATDQASNYRILAVAPDQSGHFSFLA